MADSGKARKQLLILFAIAFLTLGLSYAAFYFARSSGVWGTTNHGEFVQPSISVQQLGIEGFELGETWWLWVVAEECSVECRNTLDSLKALHILLNKDADRLQRALLVATPYEHADEHLSHFVRPEGLANGVYIIDPIGNLVLRYPVGTEPKPVQEDLKKLLRLSQIG